MEELIDLATRILYTKFQQKMEIICGGQQFYSTTFPESQLVALFPEKKSWIKNLSYRGQVFMQRPIALIWKDILSPGYVWSALQYIWICIYYVYIFMYVCDYIYILTLWHIWLQTLGINRYHVLTCQVLSKKFRVTKM